MEQLLDLLRRDAPGCADPDDQRRRAQDRGEGVQGQQPVGHREHVLTVGADRQRRERPDRVRVEAHGLPVEHRPADRRDRPLDRPAEGVQTRQAGGVGRGRDDRLRTEDVGDCCRQLIGSAAVTTEQRHRELPSLVDADHAGVSGLALQQRGDEADDRPRGQEADEAVALLPGMGQVVEGVVVGVGQGLLQ